MAIRLSGMVSGMDTESLVSALVSSYKLKKDNLVKAQTKLSWKQEKWKTMNTSIVIVPSRWFQSIYTAFCNGRFSFTQAMSSEKI